MIWKCSVTTSNYFVVDTEVDSPQELSSTRKNPEQNLYILTSAHELCFLQIHIQYKFMCDMPRHCLKIIFVGPIAIAGWYFANLCHFIPTKFL